MKTCRCQVWYSPHQHQAGWVHKVARLVFLSKRQSEWIYPWIHFLMYGGSHLFPNEHYIFFFRHKNLIDICWLQFNFVGRLLGPRGNSLKRVEANTECRVLIRGRGSIKDTARVKINILFLVLLFVPR